MKKRKPKILFFDLESSLMLATIFSLRGNDYINSESLLSDWNIISAAWKWLGEKKVYSASVLDNKNDNITNDKFVVEQMKKAIEEADIIVAHNGDRFDVKKINTRLIYHDLGQMDMPYTVDTLKEAKRTFSFTSNKLDYLAQYLKVGKKMDVSKNLWLKALRGDKKAIAEMVKYNKMDVIVLEKVYLKLMPYMTKHPKMDIFLKGTDIVCENCGHEKLMKAGKRVKKGGTFQKYQCYDCGHLTLKKEKREKKVLTQK